MTSNISNLSGESFKAANVADHYVHRPPYAAQVYQRLEMASPAKGRLLDLGCGEGKIARPMSQVFGEVVAIDPSANMLNLGKSLENGQASNINWIEATAETATLTGTFDTVSFASSIHWMNPEQLFSTLKQHLNPDHVIAIVNGDMAHQPAWEADWQDFLSKWVPIATSRPLGSKEWQDTRDRHLPYLDVIETRDFVSDPVQQSVESYVLCQHSRNTFALANLEGCVRDFRQELNQLLLPHADEAGLLTFQVKTILTIARLT